MGYIASKRGKDGKPRYYAVYKDRAGKRRWEAAGRYKKDAESLLKRRESEVRTGGKAVDLMFTNKAGNPIDGTNLLTQEFHPTLERAGLSRVRFHDLRHTYAALQIALDENFKFIQQQMGHASITTTMDLYGHLMPEASEGAGQRLDELVFSKKVVRFPTRTITKTGEEALLQD